MFDSSKIYFVINGYTIKELREIGTNKPEDKWTQGATDIYGEHRNIYSPSKKIVFTITIPLGSEDEKRLKLMEMSNIEGIGTYTDKRTENVKNITFNKAVISNTDQTGNKTEDSVTYEIKASIITDAVI